MLSRPHSRLMLAAAVAVAVSAHAQDAAPETVPTDVAALRQALYDPSTKQDQRDQTAQRLLSRPDPAARTAIADALGQFGQPAIQLAAARALADRPTADPRFVAPLFNVIDPSSVEPLINAAARALTAFKADDGVLTRLLGLARDGTDERVRLAAISAAGTFIDPRVGQTLIDLLDPTAQTPKINAAAADALAYLSGLDASRTTNDDWRTWWSENRGKSLVQFRADIALTRAGQYDRAHATVTDLQGEFLRVLSEQYSRLPAQQRPDALLRYLHSPEPTVRVVGCRIALQAAQNAEVPPAAVKEQLRQLIGDADGTVRRGAAEALALINDPGALVPLLTQLNQETDPAARSAIIDALRPIGDVRAAPILLSMLDDASLDVVQSAADALGARDFGLKIRQSNPALAESAAKKLMQTLQARTRPQENIDLRYYLVQAMVQLQSRSLEKTYMRMLSQPAEAARVRRALLTTLGEMHDPELAQTIAASLDDPDTGVQLEAIRALGNSAQSLGDYDRQLSRLIDPATGVKPEVREAAWNVLTTLFPKAQENQLPQWESKPGIKNDAPKLLVVLKEERSRARAAGNDDMVARRNQQIGDVAREAGLWNEAIPAYLDALTYARQASKSYMIESVSDGLTKAYLTSRQYDQAIDFVQGQIKADRSAEGTLGPDIRIEAEHLVNDNKDYDAAKQLITMALKMNPSLKPTSTEKLVDLLSHIDRLTKEQNLTPDPGIDRSLMAMAN